MTGVVRTGTDDGPLLLPAVAAVGIVDAWVERRRRFLWSRTPDEVKAGLLAMARGGENVAWDDALRVLRSASTPKMVGGANGGMAWIEASWRRIRFRGRASGPAGDLR